MRISQIQQHPQAFSIHPDSIKPAVTEIVFFNYAEILSGHQDPSHLHHFHQLDVILDGEFTLTLAGQENQTGRPGDAWVIPPLIWHGVNCAQPFRWCSFKFHLAPHLWPILGTTFQRFHVPQHIRACVEEMGKRNSVKTTMTAEHAASAILLCLIEFIDQHIPVPVQDDSLDGFRHALWPLLEKIERTPSIRWTVKQMAAEMNLSPDYFSRCFHHIIGQPPQRCITRTAMRNAAGNLLTTPNMPIKEIAERAGYADVQAFTHAFTRIFKISPGAYQQQHHQKNSSG